MPPPPAGIGLNSENTVQLCLFLNVLEVTKLRVELNSREFCIETATEIRGVLHIYWSRERSDRKREGERRGRDGRKG